MPTERVLVEIITAANMAGVEEAQAGFMGLSAGALGLGIGLAAMVVVGKAGVENFKKQEEATKLLKQATDTQHMSLTDLQKAYEDFKSKNAAFISDQYDTETALGNVVRSGEQQTDALRILGDALDLSVIKHETVTDASKELVLALAGNGRALKQLGITSEEYNAIMKDKLLTNEEKHHKLLDLIETKTKDGKKATDDMAQSQNALNIQWQDFTTKIGPDVLEMWKKLNEAAGTALGLLTLTVTALDKLQQMGPTGGAALAPNARNAAQQAHNPGRAIGGPVESGDYLVGEQGPEVRHFGAGGSIIPGGGGGPTAIHVHIHQGAYIDGPSIDRLANMIVERARYATGT